MKNPKKGKASIVCCYYAELATCRCWEHLISLKQISDRFKLYPFYFLFDRPHTYLISKHVALMNSSACRDFILLLWDKQKMMNPRVHTKWKSSIEGLSVSKGCWTDNIHKESVLLNVYDGGKYNNTEKVHLIRFFRNAAAHLSDHSCRVRISFALHFPPILSDIHVVPCNGKLRL